MEPIERETVARVTRRLMPFLILCYFVAYLDRVNLSFASAFGMARALDMSQGAYGLGAGVFFLAYFVFEVPSNLILERVGARRWIARIMATWGVISALMAFIPDIAQATGFSQVSVFYVLRILLGFAEAGFFPGIIFYMTLWFPQAYRARMVGAFMAAIPVSTAIGAPVSSLLTYLDGIFGFAGWQWIFLAEGLPSVILSVVVLIYLTDRPADAAWLAPGQRVWLQSRLAAEARAREQQRTYGVWETLGDTRVLLLSLIYFGIVAALYGVTFFIPTIVKGFGYSNAQTGLIAAIPFAVGAVSMVFWTRKSDRLGERREHLALPAIVAGLAMSASTLIGPPLWQMVAFTVAGIGVFAALPIFWTFPTAFLSGPAAAAGIGICNAIGNLSGYAGPQVMGSIHDITGTYTGGFLCLTACVMAAAFLALVIRHDDRLERPPL